jgi:hypothetical protein
MQVGAKQAVIGEALSQCGRRQVSHDAFVSVSGPPTADHATITPEFEFLSRPRALRTIKPRV